MRLQQGLQTRPWLLHVHIRNFTRKRICLHKRCSLKDTSECTEHVTSGSNAFRSLILFFCWSLKLILQNSPNSRGCPQLSPIARKVSSTAADFNECQSAPTCWWVQSADWRVERLSDDVSMGYTITDNVTDDADIHRKVRNLFVKTNIFRRRFYKCSMAVECILFKTYCTCLYDA